jgi:hypothetical protein
VVTPFERRPGEPFPSAVKSHRNRSRRLSEPSTVETYTEADNV